MQDMRLMHHHIDDTLVACSFSAIIHIYIMPSHATAIHEKYTTAIHKHSATTITIHIYHENIPPLYTITHKHTSGHHLHTMQSSSHHMIVQVEYLSDGRNCHQHKLQQVKTACPASLVHGIIRPPVQVADGHNQYVGTVGVPNAASKCITCIRTC